MAQADGRHRRQHRSGDCRRAQAPRGPARSGDRRRGSRAARARGRGRARPRRRGPRTGRRRAADHRGSQIRAGGPGTAEAAVPGFARLAPAAAGAARGCSFRAGTGERGDPRVHLATDRAQARRLWRRGEGARGLSRTGHHPLRNRARDRRQGQPDREPDEGPGAGAVGGQHPRGRDHSRQVVHGTGAAQSPAPDGAAGRTAVLGCVQRHAQPFVARPGQGHRRQAGGRRSRAHAAPAGRGHDRFGQIGRDQRHDPVA